MLRRKLLGRGGVLYVMERFPFAIWFHLESDFRFHPYVLATIVKKQNYFLGLREKRGERVSPKQNWLISLICVFGGNHKGANQNSRKIHVAEKKRGKRLGCM